MSTRARARWGFVALGVLGGCHESPSIDGLFTEAQWEIVEGLGAPTEVPPDPTNRYADDPVAAALGQKLFFETRYSGALTVGDDGSNGALGAEGETGKVACASCHQPQADFSDGRSQPGNVSLGTGYTSRNAPSLVNVAYYQWHGWGGKQDTLWTQASLSPESSDNTGGTRCAYAHVIWDHYREEYEASFGPLPAALDPTAPDADRFPAACKPKKEATDPDGSWEAMEPTDQEAVDRIMANCGKAVAAYERRLVSLDSPFDRYVAGDTDAISLPAKRGLLLFIGRAACVECHAGPLFTDNEFHNTGVPQLGPNVPAQDEGRFKDIGSVLAHPFNGASEHSDDPVAGQEKLEGLVAGEEDLGAFRTKALRNVVASAPYFHTGAMATLADVVAFYDEGGAASGFVGTKDRIIVPLALTSQERTDLVAFLESLTGQPIPEHLRQDTSNP